MLRVYTRQILSLTLLIGLYSVLIRAEAAIECSGNNCADIVGLDNVSITLEDSSGTTPVIYGEDEYCIISYTRNNSQRNIFDVSPNGTTSDGNFVVSLNGINIPVTVKWRAGAPVNGTSSWEVLTPSQLTSKHQGALNCDDKPNSKAWVRFEVLPSNLTGKPSGNYQGTFSVDVGNGNTGYHGRIDLNLNIPDLVKVSALDDMLLTARGNNRYRQDEQFCVFVSGGGSYKSRASGGTATNDPFLLSNGSETVKYRVRLSDNGTGLVSSVTPGQPVEAANGSSSLNCDNSTNTRLRIIVLDTWLQNKSPGVYKGTLYLTVEPA